MSAQRNCFWQSAGIIFPDFSSKKWLRVIQYLHYFLYHIICRKLTVIIFPRGKKNTVISLMTTDVYFIEGNHATVAWKRSWRSVRNRVAKYIVLSGYVAKTHRCNTAPAKKLPQLLHRPSARFCLVSELGLCCFVSALLQWCILATTGPSSS